MTKTCNTCGNCVICGWRPNREVMTISYKCDVKPGHVYPSDDDCDAWVHGEPRERAEREWEQAERVWEEHHGR